MKKNLTELVFVIDRSGSMCGLESDTIGGVNTVLAQNRAVDGDANVTTILFDNRISYLHDHVDLKEVKDLTRDDYHVGGCTALLDAIGEAITHTEKVQGYLPKDHRAEHVIVTIVTDGFENASRRYTYPQIKRMIEAHREQGWELIFLGANIDVEAEADRLGISADNAAPYVSDDKGTHLAYESVASANVAVRTCGSMPVGWADAVRADVKKRHH